MILYIKNMVCNRCILAVRQVLEDAGLSVVSIQLGEVTLKEAAGEKQLAQVKEQLEQLGFELLDDQKQQLIERIRSLIIESVQQADMEEHFSISEFLSARLHRNYSSLSKLFSEVEGITVEQFFILQKTEKVKELLVYNELSLSEIAFKLGYSSTAHLSAQFKKVTGLTPSHFRTLGAGQRRALDQVAGAKR